jgi:hypothetical protein
VQVVLNFGRAYMPLRGGMRRYVTYCKKWQTNEILERCMVRGVFSLGVFP